jgi:hypothetical protein
LPRGSKIAPHSVGLLAERNVLSFEFLDAHEVLFYRERCLRVMPGEDFTANRHISAFCFAEILMPYASFSGAHELPKLGLRKSFGIYI